jgi:hypothetical protein
MGAVYNFPGGRDGAGQPPLEPGSGGGDDGGMDTLIRRVAHLEDSVASIKEAIGRLEPRIIETHSFAVTIVPTLATKADLAKTDAAVSGFATQFPHLASRADLAVVSAQLAEKPGKAYLWTVAGVLVATFAAGAILAPLAQRLLGS